MSFFYHHPVKGDIPSYLLETIFRERLQYLKSIISRKPAVYNEYVLEGSIYDNVGHFFLCIIAIMGENADFKHYCLRAEVELFQRRLASLAAYDLRCFSKKLIASIKKHEGLPAVTDPLLVLCQHLMIKDIAHHVTSTSHNLECSVHSIALNFKYCLAFVAKRQVELNNGNAYLPCGKWIQHLEQLYKKNLQYRLTCTNLEPLKRDPRIMELLIKLRREINVFTSSTPISSNVLRSEGVENASRYFPPCMLNLHLTLRRKHRLTHDQRFYYSLFLKDIGMPVNEAIDFWREEYRQSPSGSHSCCHNWERDEKKYLYGIRHMYGLEGARKVYTTANCLKIQNSESSCSEGGCPFKFDNHKIVEILNSKVKCPEHLLSQIYELVSQKQYTSACVLSLQRFNSNCDKNSFNFTPVKFYNVAMKSNFNEIK